MLIPKYTPFLAFILIFVLQLFLLPPGGEFPLNDDWTVSLSSKSISNNGPLYYSHFMTPLNYIPILAGAGIIKLFGFSFTALRLANLVVFQAVIWVFYVFLRRLKVHPLTSFFAGLALWFNPIAFNLSYTFMGDILALLLLLLSALFYHTAVSQSSSRSLFWGTTFVVLSTLTRQTSLLLPMAVIFSVFRSRRFTSRQLFLGLILPSSILALLIFTSVIFHISPSQTPSILAGNSRPPLHPVALLATVLNQLIIITISSLPFVLSRLKLSGCSNRSPLFLSLAGFLFLSSTILLSKYAYFPIPDNLINPYGLGPNTQALSGHLLPWGGSWPYILVALFVPILAAAGLTSIISTPLPIPFLLLFSLLYTPTITLFHHFDRYLLPLVPIVILYLAARLRRPSPLILSLGLIPLVLYSSVGTSNYLSWNRVRWELGNFLVESENISPTQIEGGYEWNAWHSPPYPPSVPRTDTTPWYLGTLFPDKKYNYTISFSPPPPGNTLVTSFPVPGIASNIKFLYAWKN